MAVVSSTVSPTAGQWKYVDRFGIEHTVTTSQTFVLTIDDNSSTDVRYRWAVNSTPVTTTDGYKLEFRPMVGISTPGTATTGGHEPRYVGILADAQDATDVYGLAGEFVIECPVSHIMQHWKPARLKSSNVDYNASGTLLMTLEDQFGNRMDMPFQRVSTLAVGQAA